MQKKSPTLQRVGQGGRTKFQLTNNMRITCNFLHTTIITKKSKKQNTNIKGKNYVKVPKKNATQ